MKSKVNARVCETCKCLFYGKENAMYCTEMCQDEARDNRVGYFHWAKASGIDVLETVKVNNRKVYVCRYVHQGGVETFLISGKHNPVRETRDYMFRKGLWE